MKSLMLIGGGWILAGLINSEIAGAVMALATMIWAFAAFARAALREQENRRRLAEEDIL